MEALELLREEARNLRAELEAIDQAIAILESHDAARGAPQPKRRGRPPKAKPTQPEAQRAPPPKAKRRRTDEQKAAQSERMKRYHANKKAAKEAKAEAEAPKPRLVKPPAQGEGGATLPAQGEMSKEEAAKVMKTINAPKGPQSG